MYELCLEILAFLLSQCQSQKAKLGAMKAYSWKVRYWTLQQRSSILNTR